MRSSEHRQATIALFRHYRYMTATELASVYSVSIATARRTLSDLHKRGYLKKDGRRFCVRHKTLFYAPLCESPSSDTD